MGVAKKIIPCLDVDNGRVVKGTNFIDIRGINAQIIGCLIYDDAIDLTEACAFAKAV